MKADTTIREALADPSLLGNALAGPSWRAWHALLIAAMGEPLTDDERVVFKQLTAREREPLEPVEELVVVVGRRGGKSRAVATLTAYLGSLCDHGDVLVAGERGVVLCIAPDQRQAKITLDYCTAALEGSPILRQLIANRTTDTLTLINGIDVVVRAASFRRLRGPTYVAVIADEAAFWHVDESSSANPDSEILASVRPGLATTAGLLAIISSPYARRGEVWDSYRKNYGPAGDPKILVAQGTSRELNPTLPQSVVDRALERDPVAASAEYLAQFRRDIEGFVAREAVLSCVAPACYERSLQSGVKYFAFVDPSGGSSDSMTLSVAHKGGDQVFLDAIREARPPFSPEQVVGEFATTLKSYGVNRVKGDRYAGEWPREAFRKHNIIYEVAQTAKSDIYVNTLPLINSGRVVLLDNARLLNQLCNLERRTSRVGKDSVDHCPGGHDDVANAACGALLAAHSTSKQSIVSVACFIGGLGPGQRLPPSRIFDATGTLKLVDPISGRVLWDRETEHVSALSPLKNGCNPGPGIKSEPLKVGPDPNITRLMRHHNL